MALARCGDCGCPNGKSGNSYSVNQHCPIGYPDSGLVCGTAGCLKPANVWLLESEQANTRRARESSRSQGATRALSFNFSDARPYFSTTGDQKIVRCRHP